MSVERSEKQPCPPEVRGFISYMEAVMREPQYNHAGVPTQFAIELWKAGQINSFAQFEDYLRDVGSRVHLLAVPKDFYGPDYLTIFPQGVQGEPDYTLYVAVNGPEEAQQMRERLSLTSAENMHRLKSAGVLTLPKK